MQAAALAPYLALFCATLPSISEMRILTCYAKIKIQIKEDFINFDSFNEELFSFQVKFIMKKILNKNKRKEVEGERKSGYLKSFCWLVHSLLK